MDKPSALVVDTNVVIAALLQDGLSRQLIFLPPAPIYSPIHLQNELLEHEDELRVKSRLSDWEYKRSIDMLLSKIHIMPRILYYPFESQAIGISPDPDDFPFFATALYLNCPLWSNDKKLKKQSEVVVYNTLDLLQLTENQNFESGFKLISRTEFLRRISKN